MDELTIIIPTLNEEFYIPRLLDSIAEQKNAPKLQIVVVDANSKDKTALKVQEFQTKFSDLVFIIADPNVGHQRNVGATQAKYDYILFLDADVILPSDCLKKLSLYINGSSNFIATTIHLTERMSILDCAGLAFLYGLFLLSWLARMPVINGDFVFTTREVHKRINGFKEGAILGEDTDYGLRAIKSGAKYRFIVKTHIIASDRRVKNMGRWRLILLYSRVFLKVYRSGPVYDGIDFPFGHHHSTPKAIKAIIFDFDGTVADSFKSFVEVARIILKKHENLSDDEVEELRGLSSRQILKKLGVKVWQLPRLALIARRELNKKLSDIQLFDGMPELIRKLHSEGAAIYVVSANSPENIKSLLEKNELLNDISSVYGDVSLHGKAKVLSKLLKQESLAVEECIYVGDESRDIEASKKVKMQCIAVSWGFNNAELLKKYNPDRMVDNIAELDKALADSLKN
jgi:phosphoglycolate phosphatase